MRSIPNRYWLLVLVSLVVMGLAFTPGANELLEYQRAELQAGELWRIWTGHLVHLNTTHALLNIAGLFLVTFWVGNERKLINWGAAGVLIATAISASLYIWSEPIHYYVGLSGVLHGLLIFGLAPSCGRGEPIGWAAVLAVAIKLLYEQVIPAEHAAMEVLIAGPVVSIAHVYGALAGALLAFIWLVPDQLKRLKKIRIYTHR